MLDEQAIFKKAEQFQRVFFYRICGTGMAPAACLLREQGLDVEGFDLHFYPPLGPALLEMGIKCHNREELTAELLQSFDLIVVGNVVPRQSEEATMIEQLGVPFCSFPAALGALVLRQRNVLGICGTHGKTTTTYFALQLFEFLGESPGHLIGGVLEGRPSSQLGQGNRFFIEGDEYDSAYFHKISKFRSYHLNSMILTSLEFDHADIFSSLDEIKNQFWPEVKRLDQSIICCDQYPAICDVVEERGQDGTIWYGGKWPQIMEETSGGTSFQLMWHDMLLSFHTNIVGKCNIDNLSAVILYALKEGFCYEKIKAAVSNLKQVKRRQELRGLYQGCPVIDDFAHHPRAVQLTINAVRARYPHKKINIIFEPASATARSSIFQKEFSESFQGANNILIIRPQKPATAKNFGSINWRQLKEDLLSQGQKGREVVIGHDLEMILQFIEKNAKDDRPFLVLSNSTCLGLWGADFVEKLEDT